jgi:HAD superfamily hydrolase (TIGR01490 family)
MHLAVFDLDHTLLAADSDYLWGQFLCDQGLVDREHYETRNRQFYADYAAGELDVDAFYQFSLAPLMLKSLAEWEPLRQRFVAEQIRPRVARQAPELLARHRDRGDLLLITTATQRFITEPIAELLGVEHLLASEPEIAAGRFTGRRRRANFQAAKVSGLQTWLAERAIAPKSITAYSDSRNDIPLLELADTAVAVDPDPTLREHAERQGWPVISLR